jgi:hypothetical protein
MKEAFPTVPALIFTLISNCVVDATKVPNVVLEFCSPLWLSELAPLKTTLVGFVDGPIAITNWYVLPIITVIGVISDEFATAPPVGPVFCVLMPDAVFDTVVSPVVTCHKDAVLAGNGTFTMTWLTGHIFVSPT